MSDTNDAPPESYFDPVAPVAAQIQDWIAKQERALYSEKVIEEYHNPKNLGRMAEPDAVGIVHGWCGDTMEIHLRVNDGRIAEATFTTDGCGPTVASGSKITTMIRGMSPDQAMELTRDDLLTALGGLPEGTVHCAELAVNTLREAIAGYRVEPPGRNDGQ